MRCDDNTRDLLLALTTVGAQPRRSCEPLSEGTLFIRGNASSQRKCENGASAPAIPQKGTPLLRTMLLMGCDAVQE